jgi:hypothetical protein
VAEDEIQKNFALNPLSCCAKAKLFLHASLDIHTPLFLFFVSNFAPALVNNAETFQNPRAHYHANEMELCRVKREEKERRRRRRAESEKIKGLTFYFNRQVGDFIMKRARTQNTLCPFRPTQLVSFTFTVFLVKGIARAKRTH